MTQARKGAARPALVRPITVIGHLIHRSINRKVDMPSKARLGPCARPAPGVAFEDPVVWMLGPASNKAYPLGALASRATAVALTIGLAAANAGCGDAYLPADYAGPPAAAITGNVFGEPTDKQAQYPMLSLEWLEAPASGAAPLVGDLLGQPLRFVRSQRLDNDWDIDLPLPVEKAKLVRTNASGRIGFSVGKMVYYDDRTHDGQLDWTCAGSNCDVIKAVSPEFVVFLESSPPCRTRVGDPIRPQVDRGFHYYRLLDGLPQELAQNEPLSFLITDQTPSESDPSADLRAFAEALLQLWSISALGGC
jgi:hypothetical protein